MTATLALRPARASDAEPICLIYNQGIEDRVATLETELRTPAELREWMAARGPRHPVIIAEAAGETTSVTSVVGWGSLNVFNARPAYQHVADFSVYVERGWRGQGVGRRLLERLVEMAREIDYHKMVLSTFPPMPRACGSTRTSASPGSASTGSRACSTAAGSTR